MNFLNMIYFPCVLAISKDLLDQINLPIPKFDTVFEVARQRFQFQKDLIIVKNGGYMYEEELIKEIYTKINISLQIFNYFKGSLSENKLILGGSNLPIGDNQIMISDNKSFFEKNNENPFLVKIIILQRNATFFEIHLFDPIKRSFVYKRDLNREYYSKKPNFHQRRVHFYLSGKGHDFIMDYMNNHWNMSAILDPADAEFYIKLSNEPFVDSFNNKEFNEDCDQIVQMCLVIQKGKEFTLWIEFYHYLSSIFFVIYLITILISSLVLYLILWRKDTFFGCFCQILGVYLTRPSKWILEMKKTSLRLLFVGILLTSIVISNNLQSVLFSLSQSPGRIRSKNKLEELENSTILCISKIFCKDFFDNLESKNKYSFRMGTIEDVFYNSSNAIIMRCSTARYLLKSIPTLRNKLHIMTNLVGSFPIFHVSHYIPYRENFKRVMKSFYENGIITWTVESIKMKSLHITSLSQKLDLEVVYKIQGTSINDLLFSFIILACGHILAVIVFVIELFYKY